MIKAFVQAILKKLSIEFFSLLNQARNSFCIFDIAEFDSFFDDGSVLDVLARLDSTRRSDDQLGITVVDSVGELLGREATEDD